MITVDETTVGELLTKNGLEALLPVRQIARRMGCSVWETRLLTPYGDAAVQIQVYPLGLDPIAIVDIEEEVLALTQTGSPRDLVKDIRDAEWGLLITCAAEHKSILDLFFQQGKAQENRLTYHPQLDRILGGDYFHQFQGHWLKACLAPLDLAMKIKDLLQTADEAYQRGPSWPEKSDRPLPVPLAILKIDALDLPGAPDKYRELALIQFVIESPEVIQINPPKESGKIKVFARQLFGLLESQHRVGLCFCRDAGSCLRPEFLLGTGVLTDVYFLSRPERGDALAGAVQSDLWNALLVTCLDCGARDQRTIAAALTIASEQYTRSTELAEDFRLLIERAARDIVHHETKALTAVVGVLQSKARVNGEGM